jgi:hypothetical protein
MAYFVNCYHNGRFLEYRGREESKARVKANRLYHSLSRLMRSDQVGQVGGEEFWIISGESQINI